MKLRNLVSGLMLLPGLSMAVSCPQSKPVNINSTLIQKLAHLTPDSSNAHETELLIGPACSCVPLGRVPSEIWMCQWKGNLASNRLENTLNISFEAGMITEIVGINKQGEFLTESNS